MGEEESIWLSTSCWTLGLLTHLSPLDLIRKYDELVKEYDEIVRTLLENWKGQGALAFREDAQQIRTNITGIRDILTTMCDTLADCRAVFGECDTSLGNVNRDALQ